MRKLLAACNNTSDHTSGIANSEGSLHGTGGGGLFHFEAPCVSSGGSDFDTLESLSGIYPMAANCKCETDG